MLLSDIKWVDIEIPKWIIPEGLSLPIPTPCEPFATTLKRVIEYENGFYYEEDDELQDYEKEEEYYERIIESFELYGSFLDSIPFKERYEVINDEILMWIERYIENVDTKKFREEYPLSEANKEIQKDIKALSKFEDTILKRLWLHNHQAYDELSTIIFALKKDIQEKNFEIIPKAAYSDTFATKKELTNILDSLIQKYNIKGATVTKKQLVDHIKLQKTK